jgi:glyoxylase I family protein
VEKVLGIGGLFFRARDPAALSAWYQDHLGIAKCPGNYSETPWQQESGATVFAPFPEKTGYFGDLKNVWMVNFRVRSLDAMVAQLRAAGIAVKVDPEQYPLMAGLHGFMIRTAIPLNFGSRKAAMHPRKRIEISFGRGHAPIKVLLDADVSLKRQESLMATFRSLREIIRLLSIRRKGSRARPVFEFPVPDIQAAKRRLLNAGCVFQEEDPAFPRCYDPYGVVFHLAHAGA